ncbi:MAG TPA: BON domain-containing protein [Phnomibacter sp.]|nr:BON domain-containing protein [Phnomibacter sp.]
MKNLIYSLFAMLLLLGCKPKDADIQKGVDSAITSISGVSASVASGVVTLNGTVASEDAKQAAENAAKAVKGVKSINNNISVVVPQINADDLLNEGLKTALAAFNTVRAQVNDGVVTLTGTIKRADLQKVIQAVQELKPKKVDNQLSIQ